MNKHQDAPKPIQGNPAINFINHRLIVRPAANPDVRLEYILREVSPSGNNLKWENRGGAHFWCVASEYHILEDLGVA